MKFALYLFLCCLLTCPVWALPLTFEEALGRILERHTQVQVQKTNVNAAAVGVFDHKARFLPTVGLSGSRGNATSDGTDLPATQGASISAQINVFRWGADAAALQGANEDLHSQENNLESVKLNAEEEAVEDLTFDVQRHLQIEILSRNVEAFKLYHKIAGERFDHGLLPRQEVDKVYLDLSNAQARLEDLLSLSAQAKASLERLLGKTDSELGVKPAWPWKNRLTSQKVKLLVEEAAPALDSKPDVKAALSVLNAEEARLKSTYWAQYPSLDFSFSQGLSENEDGSNQGSVTSLGISIPLFDKLAYYSRHKVEYETYAAADLRLRQARLDAESEWHGARDRFRISVTTALSRDKALEVSQRLYAANESRLKQGRASANDIEVDERRLIEAEILEVDGWANAHVEFAKLCHSLGRSVGRCE